MQWHNDMFSPWNTNKNIFVQDDFMFCRYPTCYYIRQKYFDLHNLHWFGLFWLFSDQYSNYATFIEFQHICFQFKKFIQSTILFLIIIITTSYQFDMILLFIDTLHVTSLQKIIFIVKLALILFILIIFWTVFKL